MERLQQLGLTRREVVRRLGHIMGYATAFRRMADVLEHGGSRG